jgi:hypothetical protein
LHHFLAHFVAKQKFCNRWWKLKNIHCKKSLTIFPSPAGMSLTNLSLAGKNLIIPGQGEFG